jgi:hypothetical protein
MAYDRQNPSPRYREMVALYSTLHQEGEQRLGLTAEETYPGVSLLPHLGRIKALIERTGARTLLDYGCGKGLQYELVGFDAPGLGRIDSVVDYWDVDEIACYDPCHGPFSALPAGPFDGVLTTDVLEHCGEEDLRWIVGEMFGYARRFVFAAVASYPAKTHLPNGENAHVTIRPAEWWKALFTEVAQAHPGVVWSVFVDTTGLRSGPPGAD